MSFSILGIYFLKDFKKYLYFSPIMSGGQMHVMVQKSFFFFLSDFLFILLNFKLYDIGIGINYIFQN